MPLAIRRAMKMQRYARRHGDSGVVAYATGPQGIAVQFVDGSVGCLYPAGGLGRTSAAEMNAAELIKMKPDRREAALALLSTAARGSKGTALGVAASKALDGLK